MADCSALPTVEDSELFKQDAGTINEVVTSSELLTSPASDGKQKKTLAGLAADGAAAIQGVGWENKGEFSTLPTIENVNEVAVFEGNFWLPTEPLPYTATGTSPLTSPEAGKWVVAVTAELLGIARSLNCLNSQVIYSTDTTTVLDDVLYIYDASVQTTLGVPTLDSTGETIVSVTGSTLETTGGTYTLSNDGKRYTIDTVADIANLPTLIGARVDWLGYHAISDGGSNWGVIKSGAHTADGGSIFSIGANTYVEANLKGKMLNVRKFGAVGDSVTDDTLAIQSAFNTQESSFYFPAMRGDTTSLSASYLVTSPIIVSSKCRISGDAAWHTAGPTQIYTTEDIPIFDIRETTVSIDTLAFRGNGWETGSSEAIRFNRIATGIEQNDVRLNRLWFTDFSSCIFGVFGIQGLHVEDCTFDVNDKCISVATVADVATFFQNIIIGCRFYRSRICIEAGGSFAESANSLVQHNIISNNVFDFGGFGNTITDQDAAIVLTNGSRHNIISNNQFVKNARDVYLAFGRDNLISGNKFDRTNRNSLSIIGEEDCTIALNSFFNQNIDNSTVASEDCVITTYSVVNMKSHLNTYGSIGTNFVNQAIHFQTDPISIETNSDTFYINASDSPDKLFNQITVAKNTALLNGWVNNSNPAKLQKDGNVVYLTMQAVAGTTTAGTAVYNLPDGYRPTDISMHKVVTSTTSIINIEITTGGDIILNGTAGYWVDLNMSFRI